MCVESGLGASGIIAGICFMSIGVRTVIVVEPVGWSFGAMAVMGCGFLVKDLVFEWAPWKIRREKDHLNVMFRWKGKEGEN